VSDGKRLELDEDIHQQQQVWVIERISWALMALVIGAAATGFLGHGAFSNRRVSPVDAGYTIDYHRLERHQSQSIFIVQLDEEALQGDVVRLRLGNSFLRKAEITRIEPEPDSVELDADLVTYSFNAAAAGVITFHFIPTGYGNAALDIGLDGRPLQSHPQFVLP
jgi:hypothetical protein